MISGGVFLALGLLFICSALVGLWEGEIYALRPGGPAIYAADQPDIFHRRVLMQLSMGVVCAAGGAGYLWSHRARS